jgi:putative ABC transport system substrate-binding protein
MSHKIVFLALSALLLALSLSAEAQQPAKIPRIGWLTGGSLTEGSQGFRQGLRDLGYIEGKNIVIEWRAPEGKPDRLPTLAAELVRLKVDVIVTGGSGATQRTNVKRDRTGRRGVGAKTSIP